MNSLKLCTELYGLTLTFIGTGTEVIIGFSKGSLIQTVKATKLQIVLTLIHHKQQLYSCDRCLTSSKSIQMSYSAHIFSTLVKIYHKNDVKNCRNTSAIPNSSEG
jgi:hypothetical protein